MRDATRPDRLAPLTRRVRGRVLAHRRLLAALCAALAAYGVVQVLSPPPPASAPVLVAARDLDAGTVLQRRDLREVGYAPGTVPDGVVTATDAVGRTVASGLRRGEPLTTTRLVAPYLVTEHPDRVALPVRVTDPAAADLLRPGDRVDLLAADPSTASARTVARDVTVLAVPAVQEASGTAPAGALVLVGVRPDELEAVGVAAVRDVLTPVWRGPERRDPT